MKDYLRKVLNEQQYQAATYVDGPSLILAGAGAGKTRTLTYKIAYINSLWVHPENILAVTFTNKAANEMKERLKEIMLEVWESNVITDNQLASTEYLVPSSQSKAGIAEGDNNLWLKSDNLWLSSENPANPAWNPGNPDTFWDEEDDLDFDELVDESRWESQMSSDELDFDELLKEYDKNFLPASSDSSSDFSRIGTFHSIFLKILKQDIHHVNDFLNSNYSKYFNIADESDTQSLIRKILKDLWIKDTFTPREVKWRISRIKNQWLTAKDFLYQAQDEADEVIWKIYQLYEKALRAQNTLDFDDLLLIPYLLFKNKPEILQKWKNKFKYILVDEAQDTNKIQFDLIYMLSWPDGNITLIWDDFQSIYGWRWAVIEEFLNAKKYWPNLKIFKLEINYRSKKTIVDAGNYIIKNNKNQYEKNIQAYNEISKLTMTKSQKLKWFLLKLMLMKQ